MPKGAGRVVLIALVLLFVGCGSKESVSLSASIVDPSLTVEQQALGTFLAGQFDLRLALGKFASDSVTVESPSFKLVNAETGAELDSRPLDVIGPEATFPLELAPGQERMIGFEIDASAPVATAVADELCAGPIEIAGSVPHSPAGSITTARGTTTTVSGCP